MLEPEVVMKKFLTYSFALITVVAIVSCSPQRSHKIGVRVEPSPESTHRSPYLLYIPERVDNPHLLVIPNNTGRVSDDYTVHEERAQALMDWQKIYADQLRCALLVPIFPRPESLGHVYTHALDRDVIITNVPELHRLDLQLKSMIDDALTRLRDRGHAIEDRVLMAGYSASGMFVNRFALLHPDRVKAAAIGSPGGWPTVPLSEYNGELLPYPLGLGDIGKLAGIEPNLEAIKKLPLLFYIGSEDTNDCSETAHYEGFELTNNLFGATPADRWPIAKRLYEEAGCKASFVMYKDVGHSVTPAMEADFLAFLWSHSQQNSR